VRRGNDSPPARRFRGRRSARSGPLAPSEKVHLGEAVAGTAVDQSTPGVQPSAGKRLPGIEGLRAVAACSILVLHTWSEASPAGTNAELGFLDRFMPDLAFGVILFFTLSGFLLYRPFAAAIVRGRPLPSLRRYFRNRALRILPAYWVILLLCATLFGSTLYWDPSGNLENGRQLDPGLLARAALFLQDYFPGSLLLGIGPAWSLAVEVVFYCALPLLALLAATIVRGQTSRAGLSGKLAAVVLVPPVAPYDDWGQNWHSVLVRSFWGQADLFAFGMALAILRVDSEDGLLSLPRWWRKATMTGVLFAYAAVSVFGQSRPGWQISYSLGNTLVAAACALVLALVVLPADRVAGSRLVRMLEVRPLVAAGVVSYSIFLWHEPLIRWLAAQGVTLAGSGGFAVDLLFVATVTGLASTLTYRFVEAPALRLKFGRGMREPVPATQVEAAP
jgi:peptidoglycan/LPS O-acetylase OafA/YrhL